MMNGDRFIVNRKNLCLDESSYWLHHQKPSQLFNEYLNNTPITQQDIHYSRKIDYIKSLSNVLNIRENRRLLTFNSGTLDKYNFVSEPHWPVKPRSRPMAKPQYQVLDLPEIARELMYNVVHWSTTDFIAAGLKDIIYVWHVPSSKIAQYIHCQREVTALRADSSGHFIAFSEKFSADKLVMWNLEKTKEAASCQMPCNHRCYVTCIDWSPSNKFLAISCSEGSIVILNSSLKIITFGKEAHEGGVYRVRFSPDGNALASCATDQRIKIWRVPHLQLIHSHYEDFRARAISWHPWKSSYLAVGSMGGSLVLMNTSLGKVLGRTRDVGTCIYDLSFNRKTAELVTTYSFVDFRRRSEQWRAQINVLANLNHVVDRYKGHSGRTLYLEWSPDDNILASAGTDETIYLWHFRANNEKSVKEKKRNFNTSDFI